MDPRLGYQREENKKQNLCVRGASCSTFLFACANVPGVSIPRPQRGSRKMLMLGALQWGCHVVNVRIMPAAYEHLPRKKSRHTSDAPEVKAHTTARPSKSSFCTFHIESPTLAGNLRSHPIY